MRGVKMPEDQVAGVGEVVVARVEDGVVVDDDAPVEEQVVEAVGATGIEHEDDAAGAGGEKVPQQFLLEGLVAALGRHDKQERCIVGDLAAQREIEAGELEVALAEFVAQLREPARAVDFVRPHLAVPGEEIDFLFVGTGDVEDGRGDDGLALEGFASAVLRAVEFAQRQRAAVIAGDDDDHVRLVEAEFLGLLAALVDIEVVDVDRALQAVAGGVGVFAEEAGDVAVGFGQLGVFAVVGERDDDPHGLLEAIEVGFRLGGKGVPVAGGEVEAPRVVQRDVVQPAKKREEEHRLQEEVDQANPAGGAEAVGEFHARFSLGAAWPRRRGC